MDLKSAYQSSKQINGADLAKAALGAPRPPQMYNKASAPTAPAQNAVVSAMLKASGAPQPRPAPNAMVSAMLKASGAQQPRPVAAQPALVGNAPFDPRQPARMNQPVLREGGLASAGDHMQAAQMQSAQKAGAAQPGTAYTAPQPKPAAAQLPASPTATTGRPAAPQPAQPSSANSRPAASYNTAMGRSTAQPLPQQPPPAAVPGWLQTQMFDRAATPAAMPAGLNSMMQQLMQQFGRR